MKLRGEQDDGRLEEVEPGRHRRALAAEDHVRDVARDERAGRRDERDQEPEELQLRGVEVRVMDVLHEPGEPLIDALADRARARIRARHEPDGAVAEDRAQHLAQRRSLVLAIGAACRAILDELRVARVIGLHLGKTGLGGRVLREEEHSDRERGRDERRRPEEPAPVQRRDAHDPEEREAREQRRPQREDPEAPRVDHEAEDAGEAPALLRVEPRGVDLHHARSAEGLEVSVDATDGDEEAEQSRERGGAEREVHHHGAGRPDQHRALAAKAIGEQAVDHLAARIREERGRDDRAHVALAEAVLLAHRLVGERQVIPAHVERGVEQPEECPVLSAAPAKTGRKHEPVPLQSAPRYLEVGETGVAGVAGVAGAMRPAKNPTDAARSTNSATARPAMNAVRGVTCRRLVAP